MKNLPNFTLISCPRISVVAGTVVGVVRRPVGRSGCSPHGAAAADKPGWRPERCSCKRAGRAAVLGGFVVVGADTGSAVAADFERAALGAEEYADLRPQPRRRFFFATRLAC